MKLLPLSFLLALMSLTATAEAQVPTEDEIFGEPAAPDPKKDAAEAPKGLTAGEDALIDKLQIGGRLEIRNSSSQLEDQRFQQGPYNQNKTADIYFDTRPNKDVRVFFRTRFYEFSAKRETESTPTAAEDTPSSTDTRGVQTISQSIDELWFKWDIEDTLFITAGKQHLKWGRGRFWNPTDFTAAEVRDPFSQFDRRLGTDLLKFHLPFEKSGNNLYAVVQFDDAERNDDVGLALRGEFAFGASGETAFTVQTRRGKPLKVGFDLGTGLGPIDLNLESAWITRSNKVLFRGELDVDDLKIPEAYQDKDKWFSQNVMNVEYVAKYNDGDNVMLGVEGFYNELGYDDRELEFFSLASNQSQVLYSGKRYVGAYVNLPQPGNWNETSFILNGVHNISDKTALIRLMGTWTLYKQITLEAYVSRCVGEYGELCFKVPDAITNSPNYSSLPAPLKAVVDTLPKKYSTFIAGGGLSMVF